MDVEDKLVWHRVSQLAYGTDFRVPDDVIVLAKALKYIHDELVALADKVEDLQEELDDLRTDLDLLRTRVD